MNLDNPNFRTPENEYLRQLARDETDPLIKEQLLAILGEGSAGERPGNNTPKAIIDLFDDGYVFFSKLIRDICGAPVNEDILDLCCGEGTGLKHFGPNAFGVDINLTDNPKVIKDDLINPTIAKDYDIVTWLQGIEHFNKDDQNKIFDTILHWYKASSVMISTINKDCNPWVDGSFILTGDYNPYHLHEFDAFEFQDLARHFNEDAPVLFFSQYWVDGQSVFVSGLYEDAINFYLIGFEDRK